MALGLSVAAVDAAVAIAGLQEGGAQEVLGKRFRIALCVLTAALAAALLAGCSSGTLEASLGEEFSLAIGQTASITGEDMEVTFLDVIEDSRCPKDVVCVWEGRVTCSVEFRQPGQASKTVMLTQQGLTDEAAVETFQGYRIAFQVNPYPEEAAPVPRDEYRLVLTITS